MTARKLIQRISPLARRIASDLEADALRVQEALTRRAGLPPDARPDDLSRDQYEDLCDAVESELKGR